MATILKNDNRSARKPCTVRYRDTFGKQREKSFVTRKEAQAFMVDQERGKRYGEDVNLSAAKQRFTDVAEAWLDTVAAVNDNARETYHAIYPASDHRRGQLPTGGDDRVPAVAPGKALGLALAPEVHQQLIEQARPVLGPVAHHPGDTHPAYVAVRVLCSMPGFPYG
jgi:hypothetical protein